MDKSLRILHLEDDPDFPNLVSALLEQEGLRSQVSLATGYQEFIRALDSESFDIILADYSLPACNGIKALQVARQKCPDTPFLLISGTIGEQAAIESLRCGATDYLMKSRLERLAPAVRRAMSEAEERAQRRHAETELLRREKYFRALTENSLDVLSILNRDGCFLYNSPSLKTVLGYEPKEVAGRSAFELVHPQDLAGARAAVERALRNPGMRVAHEFRFRHADGSWRCLESVGWNRLDDPEMAGLVLNSRDISDRKRAEAEVRESERRFRDLFEGSPDAIVVADLDARILDANPAACRLWGANREALAGRGITDVIPPNRRQEVTSTLASLVAGAVSQSEAACLTDDGREIPVEVSGNRIEYGGKQAVLLHLRDISERKRSAAALKKSEASLLAAQRIAHLGSWELDFVDPDELDRNGLRWSDETYRIFGLEPGQVAISHELFHQAVHPEDRQRVQQTVRQAFRNREPFDIEHRIVRPNAEERVVRARGEFALDGGGKPVQMRGIIMDVTERKRLEEQLRQAQKMEAIGQLAGGVAHDFNNILTVIHGHASLLLSDKNLPEATGKSLRQIAQAVDRAAGLTRQLLTFSRRQVMQPRRLDLNEVVSNMTMMLGRILGEDITLRLNYSPHPALIQADASMIEQVLLNLAVNARDALPGGGQLSIRIAVVNITATHLAYHPEARPGEFVCLSVADNGCGIAPENLRRIFEPFFTTKEVGKGTGLGLATVYGVVKQHQGWIEVESEAGNGATFRVYLPVSTDAAKVAEDHPREQPVRGGKETILVVEDEAPVRELVCSILERHGYRVLQAESGAKALRLWGQTREKADLLLTDLVMPDRVNGRELAERLRREHPALKVIFTSGYSADVVGKDFVLQRGLHYLQKPYDPHKLALSVRDCLDTPLRPQGAEGEECRA